MRSGKIVVIDSFCVACGNCVGSCPRGALTIYKGLYAQVDAERCVGCGKCTKVCPAGVMSLSERLVGCHE